MSSRSAKALGALLGWTIVFSMGSVGFASAAALDPITVVSTTFDDVVPAEFSGITTTEGVQGYAGLGTGSNVFGGNFLRNASVPRSATTLTLTDLPAHDTIDVVFLLGIIDSWDGTGCSAGPDFFDVTVDGVAIFSEVFENSRCGTQSYEPPPGVELARRLNLGFAGPGGFFTDSAYDMGLDPTFQNIAHTENTLTIEWLARGVGAGGPNDESWAIDNLEVIIHPVDVAADPPADDPAETLPDKPAEVTPEVEGTVEVAEPEVVVLPRRLARTDASSATPWLLGIGLGSLGLGATIRRRAAARDRA